MNWNAGLSVTLVWAAIFIVPIVVYGAISALTGLQPPGDSPALVLAGTAVAKLGTALAFVVIYYLSRETLGERLWHYVAIWWLMYVIGEVGQAITPSYSWQEAFAGATSESIYFPLSGLVLYWLAKP